MIKNILLLSFILVFILVAYANAETPVPYTQDDRDRAIRTETKIESMDKRIDELREFMLWGFGLLLTSMFALVGFVLWDRRTAISPVVIKVKELEEENFKLKKFIKEISISNPEFARAFKIAGLV